MAESKQSGYTVEVWFDEDFDYSTYFDEDRLAEAQIEYDGEVERLKKYPGRSQEARLYRVEKVLLDSHYEAEMTEDMIEEAEDATNPHVRSWPDEV